jgi:hypothetical protein
MKTSMQLSLVQRQTLQSYTGQTTFEEPKLLTWVNDFRCFPAYIKVKMVVLQQVFDFLKASKYFKILFTLQEEAGQLALIGTCLLFGI